MPKKELESDIDPQLNTSTDQLETRGSKTNKTCCKRVSKFIFSHIGLVVMVSVYAVAGAFLFELLEQHQEAKDCQEGKGAESTNIVNLKSTLLTYIQFNISSNPTETSKDNETVANTKIENWLTDFRDQVLDIRSNYRYTGQDCSVSKWNLAGSLLFVVTIFTTIGFGHIAPVTWEGQIVCICYATIGIPLFLMCLSNISGVLGDMFRFAYSRICCRLCLRKKKPNKNAGESKPTEIENDPNNMGIGSSSQWANKDKGAKVVDDEEDLNENKEEDAEAVTVPLTVTMIIFTFYIMIGAVLFNNFENWTLIESAYFCYITLSTIGFGDFVPGQKDGDPLAALKLVLAAIYVLIGMATLAMCFDLMQEEIIAKFTWLGKKIGIVDKDEDEEEGEDKENEKESAKKELKEGKQERPSYVAEKTHFDSPAPSYSDDKENMSRLRSAYLQNVVQRQSK